MNEYLKKREREESQSNHLGTRGWENSREKKSTKDLLHLLLYYRASSSLYAIIFARIGPINKAVCIQITQR